MVRTNGLDLPRTVDDISADWMTAALSRKYPGIVVKSVAIRDIIKGACTKVRIALETNQPDFPETVMMKAGFEAHSPDMKEMHEREHLSYSDLVPTLDVETATLHFSDVAEDGRALVILEDLCLRDVTFMSLQAPIGFDLARRFLTQMAGMHARWWEAEADGLKARFPWMNYANSVHVGHYYDIMANEEEFNSFVTAPRGAAMPRKLLNADLLRQAHEKMQTFHRKMPQTVIHGDTHLGNLYVDADGNPGFLDYQPCIGPWCIDFSYFMIAGLDLLDRRRWQGALLQHYLDALAAHGVTPPSFDDAWLAYRQSVPWGLLIWMLNGSNFQTEANNTAAATRFAMAMVDLDTLAALDLE